jgi:class 3 adenylate cyclase
MDDGVRIAPSGTVTFLFTDIEGSTKRWEKHPEIIRAALERAAALFGAADAMRASTAGFQWAYFEPHLASVRAAMGDAVFEKALVWGRDMTADEAVAYGVGF